MLAIDLVIGLLIVVAAVVGARVGLVRALPIAGAAAGVLLGSRVPLLFGQQLDSEYTLHVAIVAALALGGLGAALGESNSRGAYGVARRSFALDTGLGAILTGAAAAVVVWALAPGVAEIGPVRDDVRRSAVLERFNAVLPPVRPPRDRTPPASVAGSDASKPAAKPRPKALGDAGLRDRTAVKKAERNLVKVQVTRCGGGYQGTGWIAGPSVVVTNAHVVSSSTKVTVSVLGERRDLAAQVVWFDGIHDLALLRVPGLRSAKGLPLAPDPRPGTSSVLLGFPKGKLTIRRARVAETTTKLQLPTLDLASKAGISLTMRERLVTVVRTVSGPGGSGSPIVDGRGQVVATVFAGITQSTTTLGVPNRIVRSALKRAQHPVKVPPCGAPPLNPTPAESIAARNR